MGIVALNVALALNSIMQIVINYQRHPWAAIVMGVCLGVNLCAIGIGFAIVNREKETGL